MKIPKYCILCDNYKQHPCSCMHCEDFDEFKMSESGKHLIATVKTKCKEEKINELEKIRTKAVELTSKNILEDGTRADGRMDIIDLIDNRIDKLKGENK